MSVRITFTARDPAHAAKIAAAVAAVDAGDLEELLVEPNGTGAPPGHTYRSLCAGERDGLLVARRTPKGLVVRRSDLEAYERALSEKRAAKREAERTKTATVTDINDHRIKALEDAGLRRKK